MPKTTIIILSCNNINTIEKCIESIVGNIADSIIIVDNGSIDGTYEFLCKKFGAIGIPNKYESLYKKIPVSIFREEKQNLSILLNKVIRLSIKRTDYYGIIEGDCYYADGALNKIKNIFENINYITAIVSNLIIDNIKETVIKRSFDINTFINNYDYDINMFIKSESFFKIKRLFNENYDLMCDYEILLSLIEAGPIYHCSDFLIHKQFQSNEDVNEKTKIAIEINKEKNVAI